MASLVDFKQAIYDRLDPRTRDWPFIGELYFPVVVCGGYLLLVYYVLPRFMKNREAYDLRWLIRFHNLFMIVSNFFFAVEFLNNSYLAGYSLLCQGMTYATDKHSLRIVELAWWYLLVRAVDFLDTIFFLLRKKNDHVTFQHVSHHFCCIFGGHIWLSLGMDGQTLLGLCVNASIHVVMYTYYFLASFGPHFRPYLWWKAYLTKAQIYQHFLVIAHGIIPLFYECGYPKFFIYFALPQGLLGLALFLNFYALAYQGPKSFSDVFSGAPCALSTDNDPLKFLKMQNALDEEKKRLQQEALDNCGEQLKKDL